MLRRRATRLWNFREHVVKAAEIWRSNGHMADALRESGYWEEQAQDAGREARRCEAWADEHDGWVTELLNKD